MNYLAKYIIFLLILFNLSCISYTSYTNRDDEAWQKTIKPGTTEALREYLSTYNKGKYREEALIKIEDNRWDLAKTINTIGSYSFYIEEYPNGKYNDLSKKNLDEIIRKNISSNGKESENYDYYVYSLDLIKYVGDSPRSNILIDDAAEILFNIINKKSPLPSYKSNFATEKGSFPKHFKNTIYRSARDGKALAVVFYEDFQKTGNLKVIVHEFGGKVLLIKRADIMLTTTAKECDRRYYTWDRLENQTIQPFQHSVISINYRTECKDLSTATMILSFDNCANSGEFINTNVNK